MASQLSDSPLSPQNSTSAIPENLDSENLVQGLTTAEVAERVASGDVNVVVFRSTRTYKEIFKENIFTLFHISFGIILALLAVLGQLTDAFFSGITILSNIVVGVYQEVKAKRSLDKLAFGILSEIWWQGLGRLAFTVRLS